jgi:lysyl-tRNA synthetase class 2
MVDRRREAKMIRAIRASRLLHCAFLVQGTLVAGSSAEEREFTIDTRKKEASLVSLWSGKGAFHDGDSFGAGWHTVASSTLPANADYVFCAAELIAGGMKRIYEFARVFRNGEIGPLHSPEFTMLEWYRATEDWNKVIEDTLQLCVIAAQAIGVDCFSWKGKSIAINTPPERVTLAQAFMKYAGIDLLATLDNEGNAVRAKLAAAALKANINVADDDNWSDIFTKILVAKIEPNLGLDAPTILCEYPLPEAALAQKCAHDPRVVERFELYICGVEIANGFGELTDATEQRARFEAAMREMKRIYGYKYPLDEELLSALAQMPATSGVALGFDRLVMLISGARSINDVLWTPFPVEQI